MTIKFQTENALTELVVGIVQIQTKDNRGGRQMSHYNTTTHAIGLVVNVINILSTCQHSKIMVSFTFIKNNIFLNFRSWST